MKTKRYRKNTKKYYKKFRGGVGSGSDSDSDQGQPSTAMAVEDPRFNQDEDEYMGEKAYEDTLSGPMKSLTVEPTTYEKESEAQEKLEKKGINVLELAKQVSLTDHMNWIHKDLNLNQYWNTSKWVKNTTIPTDIWIGSSAQPVIDIVPTICHTRLHLGRGQIPDCINKWSVDITGKYRPSFNDCGACMFTALGYQLQGMASDGSKSNWDLLIRAPDGPDEFGIRYAFIDSALQESIYTDRALMLYGLGSDLLGKNIMERLFVFPRMFPSEWSPDDLTDLHQSAVQLQNIVEIIILIAKAVMPKKTMMGITLHFGEHVTDGTVLDIQEKTGHYTNLYHNSEGEILVYDIQYEAYRMMGNQTLSRLGDYIYNLLIVKKGRKLISMGIIVTTEVAIWFNNNIVQNAPPKLVRWSSLPGNNPRSAFSKGGKMIRKVKTKKRKSKRDRYLKTRTHRSYKNIRRTKRN